LVMSVVVLVMSGALFLFYLQTLCEKALKQEFSRPYFLEVSHAIQLEYLQLRETLPGGASPDHLQTRLALQSDFFTLQYLLKNSDPSQRRLSRGEMLVVLYFRFQLFSLGVRHALNLQEKGTVQRLATALQFFANSVGEKLATAPVAGA
jgi:hypothetical protein